MILHPPPPPPPYLSIHTTPEAKHDHTMGLWWCEDVLAFLYQRLANTGANTPTSVSTDIERCRDREVSRGIATEVCRGERAIESLRWGYVIENLPEACPRCISCVRTPHRASVYIFIDFIKHIRARLLTRCRVRSRISCAWAGDQLKRKILRTAAHAK